jgi:hypothetical protein
MAELAAGLARAGSLCGSGALPTASVALLLAALAMAAAATTTASAAKTAVRAL